MSLEKVNRVRLSPSTLENLRETNGFEPETLYVVSADEYNETGVVVTPYGGGAYYYDTEADALEEHGWI